MILNRIKPEQVDEVYMGCVIQAGLGCELLQDRQQSTQGFL